MEALAAIQLASGIERARLRVCGFPGISLSWIRLEMVFLTGALIMAG